MIYDNKVMGKSDRILWVDSLRGVCMAAILLFHTEVYYTGQEIINYSLYVCDVLIVFFFLSGYGLMKREGVGWREYYLHRMKSILRRLVVPYFFFTSLLAMPKCIAHGDEIAPIDIVLNIVCGKASWFVTALAVSQILFVTVNYIAKGRQLVVSVASVLFFAMSWLLSHEGIWLFWNTDIALMAFVFLQTGCVYRKYEERLDVLGSIKFVSVVFVLFLIVKYHVLNHDITMVVWPLKTDSWTTFIVNSLTAILLYVGIAKNVGANRFVSWVGSHSLVYYFLCGGVPLTISAILNSLGFVYAHYWQVVVVFLLVLVAATILTWCIYHCIPFLRK